MSMMNPYSHANWMHYREEVIKLDGGRCVRCYRRRDDGVVLQVHHKVYVPGRAPWDYPYVECETLCKGCHASEHGIIMPRTGWIHLATDDLGDLCGNCDLCGTEIRYVYAIEHLVWGAMAVGTDCCDKLTGTTDAREHYDRLVRQREKKRRFVESPKWKPTTAGDIAIIRAGIFVRIVFIDGSYRLMMDDARGKVKYTTVLDAKINAFEVIESGTATKYLASRRARVASNATNHAGRTAAKPVQSRNLRSYSALDYSRHHGEL